MGAGAGARALALAVVAAGLGAGAAGCGRDCCTVDSLPIPLARAPRGDGDPHGALLARAVVVGPAGAPFQMVVDTGSPVTSLAGPAAGTRTPLATSIDLLDATTGGLLPVRARFEGIGVFRLPLGAEGDAATMPG